MKAKDCPYCRSINLAKAKTCRLCGQVLPAYNKHKNVKTIVDGIEFDSKREAARWQELKLLERAGAIDRLERQVVFELAPGVQYTGKRATPALRYVADFAYREPPPTPRDIRREDWARTVEDAKGMRTAVYKIKRHLMLSVHGIEVREV